MKQDIAMYRKLTLNYDKDYFLNLFSKSAKDISSKIFVESAADLPSNAEVIKLLEHFPFIQRDKPSVSIAQLRKEMKPYINDHNNGSIIIPLAGDLFYNFYSYPGTLVNGRPTLSPDSTYDDGLIPTIEATLIETVQVDRPMIFNGQITHSYGFTGYVNPVYLSFKIPEYISWTVALESLNLE
jgi:hypothetical protein